ncbi:NADH-quinone oxidoreductase subunit A [Marinobacterium sedimentorum]|uniref:NADH-quinone oxidoreductase subunit A n=1 Tax=Marinobacterium sedimentorum TaxID=2927804 RepID=UPI0020C6CDB4|nr:NADH-quinone oxidoreductase subunit A [Marinobacterium sedimentorum]MCP8686198.1 NADH-quinone oxidoreductase subunit A [Marinobacterium sedimentorum]
MSATDLISQDTWTLLAYALAVLLLVAIMLGVSHLFGPRHYDRATDEPFESGIVAVGSARLRLSISYFVVAILFVIFDLEVIFLYAWALAFDAVGLAGFVEALIFMLILFAALLYLWREGALDWGPRQRSLKGRERSP